VLGGHTTPAHRSAMEAFATVPDEITARVGESIYADKDSDSQLNRYILQVRELPDGIMHQPHGIGNGRSPKELPIPKSAEFDQRGNPEAPAAWSHPLGWQMWPTGQ